MPLPRTPSPLSHTPEVEHPTPNRAVIRALKQYTGDKLSKNEIFQPTAVLRRTGYQILKGESSRQNYAGL